MESLKNHINKKHSPIIRDLAINRVNKKNKIKIIKNREHNNFFSFKTQTNLDYKKTKYERNLSIKKYTFLRQLKISDNSKNLLKNTFNKNNLYNMGNLISNLKTLKTYSINIKQKNNQLITNINNNQLNKNNSYNIKNKIHSEDKVNKKIIEKDGEYNKFHLSCKTFNTNNNIQISNGQIDSYKSKVFKKNSNDTQRNIDNIDTYNFIQKYKKYKVINKNIQKNNININLNINNIQNDKNIENIKMNKISSNQNFFLARKDLLNSYINNGKILNEKPQDKHFTTLQNNSHEKRNINYNNYNNYTTHTYTNSTTNPKNNRNSFNSTNIKNRLNFIRDKMFKKNNKDKKNIKLNYNILINKTNKNINDNSHKFSSIDITVNNKSKKNNNLKKNNKSNNVYNNIFDEFTKEFFENKTINNENIKKSNLSKRNYNHIITSKKKNFISFGEILKKENKLFNINKLKNNIILKLSKSKNNNNKIILINNIKIILNQNYNINKKPKNYFNQKKTKIDEQKKFNNNYYTIIQKDNNNNTPNSVNTTHGHGLKFLITKNKNLQCEKNKHKNLNEKINNDYKDKHDNINDDIYINSKPEYINEYNEEILINLLLEEYIFNKKKKLILNTDILTNYGINPNIRSCLIDSLIGLQGTFQFCDKTLFITIQIFDNYISEIIALNTPNLKIEEADLDIIIVSCFLIASKMEESFIYHLSDYLSILSEKYNTDHLINMEYNILKYYNFEVFSPNTLDFLEIFSSLYNIDDDTRKKGIIILFIILLNIDLSQIPSSIISFTVLYLIMKKDFKTMMNKVDNLFYNLYKWSDWNQKNFNDKEKNETYSKYMKLISPLKNESELKEISDMIIYFVENIDKNEFINISKKMENLNDSFILGKNKK